MWHRGTHVNSARPFYPRDEFVAFAPFIYSGPFINVQKLCQNNEGGYWINKYGPQSAKTRLRVKFHKMTFFPFSASTGHGRSGDKILQVWVDS